LTNDLLREKIETEKAKQKAIYQRMRPSTLFRSFLYYDEEKWICVAGLEEEQIAKEIHSEEITCRIYGYGQSPEEAMADFDRAWYTGEFEVEI